MYRLFTGALAGGLSLETETMFIFGLLCQPGRGFDDTVSGAAYLGQHGLRSQMVRIPVNHSLELLRGVQVTTQSQLYQSFGEGAFDLFSESEIVLEHQEVGKGSGKVIDTGLDFALRLQSFLHFLQKLARSRSSSQAAQGQGLVIAHPRRCGLALCRRQE